MYSRQMDVKFEEDRLLGKNAILIKKEERMLRRHDHSFLTFASLVELTGSSREFVTILAVLDISAILYSQPASQEFLPHLLRERLSCSRLHKS